MRMRVLDRKKLSINEEIIKYLIEKVSFYVEKSMHLSKVQIYS